MRYALIQYLLDLRLTPLQLVSLSAIVAVLYSCLQFRVARASIVLARAPALLLCVVIPGHRTHVMKIRHLALHVRSSRAKPARVVRRRSITCAALKRRSRVERHAESELSFTLVL